jgi:hypothetical protein
VAGFLAVLKALARAFWRDLRTFNSIAANNFFLLAGILLLMQPGSAGFFLLVVALLLLFPLSADPLKKIPPERLDLWPLSPAQRICLRVASVFFSPVAWITVFLLLKTAHPVLGLQFLLFAVLIQFLSLSGAWLARRVPRGNPLRDLPRLPGTLGGLVRKDLRQLLSSLDPYVALLLSLSACAWRIARPDADPQAFPILALVIALTLSTYAQCLFGLDLPSGLVRYRILPLRGWQILLAKDIALLMVLFVLVLPLGLLPGMTASLVALGIGHPASVRAPLVQHRWRFTGGVLFPTGLAQAMFMTAAGVAAQRQSPWYFAGSVTFYFASLWYGGRLWDRGNGTIP